VSPRITALSAATASVRARSKQVAVTALTNGFTRSICAMHASSRSTGEMTLLPMSRRSSTADFSTSSVPAAGDVLFRFISRR
jgi:hypothetical protein